MKTIKNWHQFNELQYSTYQDAANKLSDYGHNQRASDLRVHSKNIQMGKGEDKQYKYYQNNNSYEVSTRRLGFDSNDSSIELWSPSHLVLKVEIGAPHKITTNLVDRNSAKVILPIINNLLRKQHCEEISSFNQIYRDQG